MSSVQVRRGIIVCGEDSESDDDVTFEAVAPRPVVRPSSSVAPTAAPNLKSASVTASQSQTVSGNSSLLHQKLGENKQRLQSHIHSTFVAPIERQRQQLQQVAQGGTAGRVSASLLTARDTLTRTSAGLRTLDALLAALPTDNLAMLKCPLTVGQ